MRLVAAVIVAVVAGIGRLPAQEQSKTPFTFTNVDLKLLEECKALDREFESRALVYHDSAIEKHLVDIATPLLPAAPLEHVEWRFRILRDPMINAFALPNGSIYVNTGLLARAENDDQLTSVLAHEVTHVVNHHAYIFYRSVRKKAVATEMIAIAVSWIPAGSWGAAVTVAANAGQFVIVDTVYGYSRQLERQADHDGMERLQGTGRDPGQMVRFFELVDHKIEPEPVPRLFWDHPRLSERIAYLKAMIGPERPIVAGEDPAYVDRLRPAILQNIQLDLDSRRFRSAVAAAERLVAAHGDDPMSLYWLGECYRALGPRQKTLTEQESTNAGLRQGYSRTAKRTEDEDAAALAGTPEGRELIAANQRCAEELFLKAAALDPALADPQFGLGSLYEQQGKDQEAITAYRRFIELSHQTAEQRRAARRIEGLTSRVQGSGK